MKTAEEIYESNVQYERNDISDSLKRSILGAIITAQKETIIECAKVARAKPIIFSETQRQMKFPAKVISAVDRQSILSLINELK